MKKFSKDLFFSVLVITFFFLTSNVYAQTDGLDLGVSYKSTIETLNLGHGAEPDEYNSARSQGVNANTAVVTGLLLLDPSISSEYASILESDNITPDMKRGIYGMAQDSVSAMYRSQPSVNVYAHLAEEWIPGHQSNSTIYAASASYDSGYAELMNTGINVLWTQARNITYVFFILVMIIVGFMIMFRSKLGGQTLVTIGNTLPNIILALIGVTFSFAIAGLIIDIGGVIMAILVDIFENASGLTKDATVTLESFFSLYNAVIPRALMDEVGATIDSVKNAASNNILSALGIGGLGLSLALIFANAGTGIIVLLLLLIILGIATVGIVKVFITLIKAYLGILINVITGPFQIALSAVPGKGVSFINWIKNILRHVIVYPIVFAILNLPGVIYSVTGGDFKLPGPDKLTVPSQATTVSAGSGFLNIGGLVNGLMIFIVQIFVIFVASKADKYAQAAIPPTTSQQAGNAALEAKKALSGIPLVGSLLK